MIAKQEENHDGIKNLLRNIYYTIICIYKDLNQTFKTPKMTQCIKDKRRP